MSEKEKTRLESQLSDAKGGIESLRQSSFRDIFFLCTLSSSMEQVAGYDNLADTSFNIRHLRNSADFICWQLSAN